MPLLINTPAQDTASVVNNHDRLKSIEGD